MSKYLKVTEDYVQSLLDGAAWDHVGVQLTEATQEVVTEDEEMSEEHVCPLCETTLEEELSDEAILEHLDKISSLLVEEDSLDEQGALAPAEDEEEEEEEEEEGGDLNAAKKARKTRMKEKVKELKEKWSGAKEGDKPAKDKEGDKPDFTTGARKGDEDAEDTGKDYEGDGNGNGNGKGDPKAFGGKKGDKSKTHKGKDFAKKA